MADVEVADVIDAPAGDVSSPTWEVQFLNGGVLLKVAADIFQIEPSNSTVVLQLGGEVVFTAPLGGVQYVRKVTVE